MVEELSLRKKDNIRLYFKILIASWFLIFLAVVIYFNYEINDKTIEGVDNSNIFLPSYIADSGKLKNEDSPVLKTYTHYRLLDSQINRKIGKVKDRYHILMGVLIAINLIIGLISFALYRYMRGVHNDLKEVRHLSSIDELTHVYNRRKFNQVFVELWENAKKEKQNISLMLIDLDYFKEFNDNYGHSEGDIMLRTIGEILENEASKFGGYVFRYGGDEFVILFPDLDIVQGEEIGNNVLEAIRDADLQHPNSPIEEIQTASIGVTSTVPNDRINIKEFFNHADTALYLSKRYGRNRVSVWKI